MTGEFELIRRHAPQGAVREDVVLGSGDDAALLQPQAGKQLVATVDTLVGGRHFPEQTSPYDIGWKSLAVNLSDLAAMGAEACWATVALTLPSDIREPDAWMAEFCDGLQALAEATNVAIVGGDLTRGPLSITVQALGQVKPGLALRRDTAQLGDVVAVTGCLGDAALGLWLLQSGQPVPDELITALNRPRPCLQLGEALSGRASAAIDISDGLAADLGHILAASGVGARIRLDDIPTSIRFKEKCPSQEQARLVLSGGDDYQLCVCLDAGVAETMSDYLTVIGEITDAPGLVILDHQQQPVNLSKTGYDHFS